MVDWRTSSYRELKGHAKSVRCLKMTKSKLVTGSNDNTVKVWDLNSKSSAVSLEGHTGGVTGVDVDGGYVVSGSWDGGIRIWEPARTNKSLSVLSGHNGPVLSVLLKESILASCSADKTLRLWRLHKNSAITAISEALEGHDELISCMQFAGSYLLSASFDCMAKMWDISKAYCVSTLYGHTGPIQTMKSSGSLAVTGSFDKTVKVWDLPSRSCVHTFRENSLIWKLSLWEYYIACGTLDGGLCMWDRRNWAPLFRMPAHDGCVKDLTFSNGICNLCPYSNVPTPHIVSGSSDSTVKVWCVDHAPDDCARVLRMHSGEVTCVEAGDSRVATGGVDGKVCLCKSKKSPKAITDSHNCPKCNNPTE